MKKLLLTFSIFFICQTGYSQEKSNFSFSFGIQSNMLHSGRFQNLIQNKDISKNGSGFIFGTNYRFSNFCLSAKYFREGFDVSNSTYIEKGNPVLLRGYEGGLSINMFPKIKFLRINSGISYQYSAIGSTELAQTTSSSGAAETNLNPSFINSVAMSFPSIGISIESKRNGILNFFIDGSQPIAVKSKTFSKVTIGILLF
jgi:hypothetical protein